MTDWQIHAIGGAALVSLAAAWLWQPLSTPVLLALYVGLYREGDQHGPPPGWTWHVWREALAWPAGALLLAAVVRVCS